MLQPKEEEDLSGSKLLYNYPLFRNYLRMPTWDIIKRTYEKPIRCFYLVFKPFLSCDDKNYDGMTHVKKYMYRHKFVTMIITREILEKRIHFNVIIWTKDNLKRLNDKKTSKYYIYSEELKEIADRQRVHEYIIKESKYRHMYNSNDVIIKENKK